MPLAISVKLWNTTSRETWMSIAQRRLRTAVIASSGAAMIVIGARAVSRSVDNCRNRTASAYSTQVVDRETAQGDAEQVDMPPRIQPAC